MTKNTNKRPALSSSARVSYEQSELENLAGDLIARKNRFPVTKFIAHYVRQNFLTENDTNVHFFINY